MSFDSDLKGFQKQMERVTDPDYLHKRLIEKFEKEIVSTVISIAQTGRGPDGKEYPKYSEAYRKIKEQAKGGTKGRWLRGVGNTGKKGGMLDADNFSLDIERGGGIWLVYDAPDNKTDIRAHVHNDGLPIGRGGPKKVREFVGWYTGTIDAYIESMQIIIDDVGAETSVGL